MIVGGITFKKGKSLLSASFNLKTKSLQTCHIPFLPADVNLSKIATLPKHSVISGVAPLPVATLRTIKIRHQRLSQCGLTLLEASLVDIVIIIKKNQRLTVPLLP